MQPLLDISSLKMAFASFEKALNRFEKNTSDLEIRDACIQRFEYTYELAVKMLKRQLEFDSSIPNEIEAMGFKDRIRYAYEKSLLDSPTDWFEFRDMRNRTSHTYDETEANKIVTIFPKFQGAVTRLIDILQARNAH